MTAAAIAREKQTSVCLCMRHEINKVSTAVAAVLHQLLLQPHLLEYIFYCRTIFSGFPRFVFVYNKCRRCQVAEHTATRMLHFIHISKSKFVFRRILARILCRCQLHTSFSLPLRLCLSLAILNCVEKQNKLQNIFFTLPCTGIREPGIGTRTFICHK